MREYIETNVEWCPTIPSNWELRKVKNCFYISKTQAGEKDPVILKLARSGVQVRDITNNEGQLAESYENYNPVAPGDLLLNPMDLYSGANCNMSEISGVISPAYVNLRATNNLNPKYFDYYFKVQYWTMAMFAHGKGVSFDNRWTINADGVRNYEIPFPSKEEQDAIVNTINSKLEKVDSLIVNQEAQIEKLKAYKQSLITEVVTKGIDKSVPMKDSGVEWIGEIPVNWNIISMRYVIDGNHPYPIGDGDHGMIGPSDYQDSGIPYIRVQNLGWGTELQLDNLVFISEENNDRIKNSTLRPDDILFAKTGATIGKTGIIPVNMPIANTTSHVGKLTVDKKYNPKYILYVLTSFVGFRQFWEIACQNTTRPELGLSKIRSISLLIPKEKRVQDKIVDFLDERLVCADRLIQIKQCKIEKLNQYKKSLIYEYITGKKEVV